MGRGKALNDFEKCQINAFKALGLSERQIAIKINRSRSVIHHFIKDEQRYGTKKSPGRPPFFTERSKRQLFRIASKGKFTATEIATKLMLSPSNQTIRRALKASGNF